jgi:Flp pilus assembly protein TadD
MDAREPEAQRIRRDAEAALKCVVDAEDVLPMLHRLARRAPDGSEESLFAHRELAEIVADRDPWRASLHARRVLRHLPDDERAWASLALCLTMMGHYRYAVTAYRRAAAAAPKNPWYAHNLGHLIDVALGRPAEAVPWLTVAYKAAPWSVEMAASCAHALARAGRRAEARKIVARALKTAPSRELEGLARWIDTLSPSSPPSGGLVGKRVPEPEPPPRRARRSPRALSSLIDALDRGLAHLPFDAGQRDRATALARSLPAGAGLERGATARDLACTAAAVAYAVAYVDRLPLTQAEVAACFRVSVTGLRQRFTSLRPQLPVRPRGVLPSPS